MSIPEFTRTKIVATLGPATISTEMLRALIDEGVDVFRLNMSHMDHDTARDLIARIRRLDHRCGILVDLQGPKMRLTDVVEPFPVHNGDAIVVRAGEETGSREAIYVPVPELIAKLEPGHHLLIDDGLLRFKVVERRGEGEILATVVSGGVVRSRKGVAAPEARFTPEQYIDEGDLADIRFAARKQVDFIAASFVSRAADVRAVREAMGDEAHQIGIVAKIESRVGIDNIQEIIDEADGIMIARGDLGVEIPAEEVPLVQKRVIKLCKGAAKPVIVATQMLESMVNHPIASRAETSDVANAILDGTDAVMLSAETSVGRYPVEAVKTIVRISHHVETEAPLFQEELFNRPSSNTVEFVCKSAARVAEELNVKAIVGLTSSGFTARNMAAFRPRVPIFATTPSDRVVRRLNICYGVYCIQAEHIGRYDVMLYHSLRKLCAKGLLTSDDTIAVIGGIPVGKSGSTNLLQVGTVGELMEID